MTSGTVVDLERVRYSYKKENTRRKKRQVLIDKRTNVLYNYCIATLGKMLNSNSNKKVYGQFDFPFGWPLI